MSLQDLCHELGLGDDPAAVLTPLLALYEAIDQDITKRSAGLELPCKPGCDACCHESVFLSAPELLAVAAELLATRSAEQIEVILEEMSRLAARFADELELLESITPGAERDEVASRVRFRCPLLGADGRCSVYAARELNARTFGASRDGAHDRPYGCDLTHARLKLLPPEATNGLADAREARRSLAALLPGTERVHVFPWWFERYGAALLKGRDVGSPAP